MIAPVDADLAENRGGRIDTASAGNRKQPNSPNY
jgi:hypothetical protein